MRPGTTSHSPLGRKGCTFKHNDGNPTGGAACLVPPPISKNFISTACLWLATAKGADASQRQSSCRDPCGIFQGSLIRILGPYGWELQIRGYDTLNSNTSPPLFMFNVFVPDSSFACHCRCNLIGLLTSMVLNSISRVFVKVISH